MDTPSPVYYFILVLLLAASAFFSASETAFSSLNKIRLKNLASDGDARAILALEISDDFDRVLSTILIGNNVVNLSASSIATVVATVLLGAAGAAVSTIVLTVLVLIFGEILPKSYAKQNAEAVALKVARPLRMIQRILTPIAWVFLQIQRCIKPRSEADTEPSVTGRELKTIIQNSEDEGVLDEQESDIIQSVLDFDEITVQQILIPRVDMVAIDIDDDLSAILETAVSHGFSRIPVYEGTIDNIIGIIHVKDVLETFVHHRELDIRELVRECIYVYRTKKISDLLGEFKQQKLHLAIVTDEYGGTLGLATMEDVLEELVGEIWDESDEIRQDLIPLSENSYELHGDLNIEDFFEQIDYSPKNFSCEYSTVGGWALESLGHIPEPGESFEHNTLRLTVTEMDDQRVFRLRADLMQPVT